MKIFMIKDLKIFTDQISTQPPLSGSSDNVVSLHHTPPCLENSLILRCSFPVNFCKSLLFIAIILFCQSFIL